MELSGPVNKPEWTNRNGSIESDREKQALSEEERKAEKPEYAASAEKKAGKKKRRGLAVFSAGALAGALLMAAGLNAWSGNVLFSKRILSAQTAQKAEVLKQLIEEHYYKADEVTDEQLEEGIYKGMLEALDDPYSVYYTTEEVEKLNETISGTYTGIGAYVSRDSSTGCPKIAGVIAGAPAEKAGLQTDDILWKADGELLQDLELDMAVSRIKGEKGTVVHLTVIRDGKEMEFDVTRDEVHSETVAGKMLENQIGYLQIAEFDDVTPEQFTEELEKLQDQGIKGLIVDLRNNPGGTVEAVTSIAQHLIPEGLVFYMQYPDGSRKEYKAEGTEYVDLPIAVLVNGNSASASEILSSAIQDSGAGTVIGTQTYGKGVVQTIQPLTDGSAVKITIAKYFTPKGNDINKKGITPDVEAELSGDITDWAELTHEEDTQLQTALKELGQN